MTNKELKLELAKLAMTYGHTFEYAKAFYDWITEEPEREVKLDEKPTMYDNTPIEELAYKSMYSEGAIIKRCKENGINTVGDIIRCGAHKFRSFRLVGRTLVSRIDEVLEKHYNIENWYTT